MQAVEVGASVGAADIDCMAHVVERARRGEIERALELVRTKIGARHQADALSQRISEPVVEHHGIGR